MCLLHLSAMIRLIKMEEGDITPFGSLLEKLPLSTCTLATPRFRRQDECES